MVQHEGQIGSGAYGGERVGWHCTTRFPYSDSGVSSYVEAWEMADSIVENGEE